MDNLFEYYIVLWSDDDDIPRLVENDDCPEYLYAAKPIEKPELMQFDLGDPIPRKPKMTDYLTSPKPVVSKKIYDVLEPMKIEGIQLLPAIIHGKDEHIFDNYWAVHIYNIIKCVDTKLSKCKIGNARLSKVEKIVLDKNILNQIPLNKRLIFRLKEDTSYELFHVSIMNAIMKVNPTGIRFIKIEEWTQKRLFDD